MNMIFHHPLPLGLATDRASSIRPALMRDAFKSLGFNVYDVAGYSKERKRSLKVVEQLLTAGQKFEFLYSENSTAPTMLCDPHHLPVRPFVDLRLFRLCNRHKIPVKVFYRDIYWRFPGFYADLGVFKKFVSRVFHYLDLAVYAKTADVMFLPTLQMRKYVPIGDRARPSFDELPPGHRLPPVIDGGGGEHLKLFYVGGVGFGYEMRQLINVVSKLPFVSLTLCVRRQDWERAENPVALSASNIEIVHLAGEEMRSQLLQCDVAVLYLEPSLYRSFTAPVKLFEYIGNAMPILASTDTWAGEFVQDEGLGWSIEYNEDELEHLLCRLHKHRNEVERMRAQVLARRDDFTWMRRAEKVLHVKGSY